MPHTAPHTPDSKHAHKPGTSTQPEDLLIDKSTNAPAQGEHISTSAKEPSKPVHTAEHLEHTHKPELPAVPPTAPENCSVPANTTASCCTTHQQASASTQPCKHVVLDSNHAGGKFHHVLWTQVPNILFATTLLTCFSNCFGAPHINALKCIFQYLANTAPISITYDGNMPFYKVTYSDTNFTSQYIHKLMTSLLVMMGDAVIA
jgi:hypothetical protein